jgi:peptidoglycan/xylan/chitin deacetylase (PgdA/CDA1 family)
MRSIGSRIIAVLSFHKIGEPSDPSWYSWFYIPEKVFAAQLDWLGRNGWSVISIEQFLRGISDPELLPERSALLTFDDGYESMATVALPCLKRFGYPGVVFVPAGYIGGTNVFDLDNEPEERMCTWDELRQLEACAVSVQSHSLTHRPFSELSAVEQRREIETSKSMLESSLQKTVEVFAFPYGDGGDAASVSQLLSRGGYRAAFLYAANEPYDPDFLPAPDPFRLDRLAVGPDTDLALSLGKSASRSAR